MVQQSNSCTGSATGLQGAKRRVKERGVSETNPLQPSVDVYSRLWGLVAEGFFLLRFCPAERSGECMPTTFLCVWTVHCFGTQELGVFEGRYCFFPGWMNLLHLWIGKGALNARGRKGFRMGMEIFHLQDEGREVEGGNLV